MPDDTLTADELRAITGKAQPKSQAAALADHTSSTRSAPQIPAAMVARQGAPGCSWRSISAGP